MPVGIASACKCLLHAAIQEKIVSNPGLCGTCLEKILRHAWLGLKSWAALLCHFLEMDGNGFGHGTKNDPHPLLAIYRLE